MFFRLIMCQPAIIMLKYIHDKNKFFEDKLALDITLKKN
jgi:hypothetical protein